MAGEALIREANGRARIAVLRELVRQDNDLLAALRPGDSVEVLLRVRLIERADELARLEEGEAAQRRGVEGQLLCAGLLLAAGFGALLVLLLVVRPSGWLAGDLLFATLLAAATWLGVAMTVAGWSGRVRVRAERRGDLVTAAVRTGWEHRFANLATAALALLGALACALLTMHAVTTSVRMDRPTAAATIALFVLLGSFVYGVVACLAVAVRAVRAYRARRPPLWGTPPGWSPGPLDR